MSQADITFEAAGVERGGRVILRDLSFGLGAGTLTLVLGPNGGGKSTLARLALGLERPSRGKVIRKPRLVASYAPQLVHRDQTLPLSVSAFLRLGARRGGLTGGEAAKVIDLLGLASLLDRPAANLSGGEMRRAVLARALLRAPDLLVLDEPLSGIDYPSQQDIYRALRTYQLERHCTVLLVAHEIFAALALADQVICIDGRVLVMGAPAEVVAHEAFARLFGTETQEIARRAILGGADA